MVADEGEAEPRVHRWWRRERRRRRREYFDILKKRGCFHQFRDVFDIRVSSSLFGVEISAPWDDICASRHESMCSSECVFGWRMGPVAFEDFVAFCKERECLSHILVGLDDFNYWSTFQSPLCFVSYCITLQQKQMITVSQLLWNCFIFLFSIEKK